MDGLTAQDRAVAEGALAWIDAMTEAWAERFGIAESIKSIPVNCINQEHQARARDLILRHVKLAYSEGLLTGSISLQVNRPHEGV